MNLDKAIRNINRSLTKKEPKYFSPIWIKYRCNVSYKFIVNNITDELGEPDWDLITTKLDRKYQKLWLRGAKKKKQLNEYEDEKEVMLVIAPYSEKLYTFVSQVNKDDRTICDHISIRLVRLAQKGNLLANKKLKLFISFLINQWVESYTLSKWRGYDDLIDICINNCIKRYRYSGSFIGYLNRTMELSGRSLKTIEAFSLDKKSQVTGKSVNDKTSKDYTTGEVTIF